MSIQLVSHPLWPLVHHAAAMLYEKDVTFDITHLDVTATPDRVLSRAPRRTVPVFVADGVTS